MGREPGDPQAAPESERTHHLVDRNGGGVIALREVHSECFAKAYLDLIPGKAVVLSATAGDLDCA